MSIRLALFSSMLPSDFTQLFGHSMFCPPEWSLHYFTTDHPNLGRIESHCWPFFHYLSFPSLHKRFSYDLLLYFVDKSHTSFHFIDVMESYPGVLLLESLDLHRERYRNFAGKQRYHHYLTELTLNHGQRGFEAGKLLLHEGEQHVFFAQLPLLKSLIQASLGIVLLDPRHEKIVQTWEPERPIHTLLPFTAQVPAGATPLDIETVFTPSQRIREKGVVRCSVLFKDERSPWKKAIQENMKKLGDELDLKIVVSTVFFPDNKEEREKEIDLSPIKTYDEIVDFLLQHDVVISDHYGASVAEFSILSQLVSHGVPVLLFADSLLGHLHEDGVVIMYPGRAEILQLYHNVKTLLSSLELLDYVAEAGRSIVRNRYNPDMMKKQFHHFLDSIRKSHPGISNELPQKRDGKQTHFQTYAQKLVKKAASTDSEVLQSWINQDISGSVSL